jgi:ABC-type multidrug transport system fused ATPase/permease subunit
MLAMFLSLFLRYFRPYWARLALAILATVFVGLLSVAPVLIFRESLVVIFIAGGGAPGQDLSDLGDLQHLVNLPDPNAPPKPHATSSRRARSNSTPGTDRSARASR